MGGVSGLEVRAAVRQAATWGTAAQCGAGHGVLLTGDTMKSTRDLLVDDSLGNPFAQEADTGNETVTGTLSAFLRYEGLERLLALAMGVDYAPVQIGSSLAYSSAFNLADNTDGRFATIAINKKISLFEYPSAKITGFTIRGEAGGVCTIDFDVVADHENNDGDNSNGYGANTLASFGNVTYPSSGNRALFSQGMFRINEQSGAALGVGDNVAPNSFELSFKRKLRGFHTNSIWRTIDEPTNDGQPEIRLKIGFPRFADASWLTSMRTGAVKKASIDFSGQAIPDSGTSFLFNINLPSLQMLNADAPTQKGIMGHSVEFEVLNPVTPSPGMDHTGTKSFRIGLVNTMHLGKMGA